MDWEAFEKHKAFAGEKKPSMLRRRVGHDYEQRCVYLVTMTVEGRKPLLQVSPWEYHMNRSTISREQCLQLNRLAEWLAEH